MPISKKILAEIDKLDATSKEKQLLTKILELEDGGLRNYTNPYEREISLFIDGQDGSEKN